MSLLQLVDKRNIAIALMAAIVLAGTTEKRQLNPEETVNVGKLDTEITDLNSQIAVIQAAQANPIDVRNFTPKPKMEKKVSLISQINQRMEGTVKGAISMGMETKEEIEERATIQAQGAAGTGIEVVATQKMQILEPLRESLVMVKAGATFMSNLTSDISLPNYGGTSALWKGEIAAATDGAGTLANVDLKPKRLTTTIKVAKLFLIQDNVGANAMLMADIVKAVAIKLQNTILGKEAGSDTQPAGFFAAAPAIKGAVTFKNMVALETAVDTGNALIGNLAYITNAGGRGILKTTPKVAGFPAFLVENNEMNGYPVIGTNSVAKGLQVAADEFGVVFGNWNDFVIAQFGNLDLTVDPYTAAGTAEVVLTINGFFDAAARRTDSFAVASIK
jgi:hypothetical protein